MVSIANPELGHPHTLHTSLIVLRVCTCHRLSLTYLIASETLCNNILLFIRLPLKSKPVLLSWLVMLLWLPFVTSTKFQRNLATAERANHKKASSLQVRAVSSTLAWSGIFVNMILPMSPGACTFWYCCKESRGWPTAVANQLFPWMLFYTFEVTSDLKWTWLQPTLEAHMRRTGKHLEWLTCLCCCVTPLLAKIELPTGSIDSK
jgi:hypothetical protein